MTPRALVARRAVGTVVLALRRYILHQSANQAGSIAFSWLLAMFPLLLFASAAAAYVGRPADVVDLAERVLAVLPPFVRQTLQPAVAQVLGQRNQALLAIGLVVTIWTASSGVQAIRTALNNAYGVPRGLPFWMARIKVTLFTVLVGLAAIASFGSVVVMPYVWSLLEANVGIGPHVPWARTGVRYASAFVVVATLYALLYGWLPDTRQRLRTVLPGALLGALLWLLAAAALSYVLRSAGKLALIYGGFAGLVATLVFLYLSASTLIFGAEFNAALRDRPSGRR